MRSVSRMKRCCTVSQNSYITKALYARDGVGFKIEVIGALFRKLLTNEVNKPSS